MIVQLCEIAQVRSGDKGDCSDISLFAQNKEMFEVFKVEITAEKVFEHFKPMAAGPVQRFEMENVLALKFLIDGALAGGASQSLRSDNLGKCFGSNLLRMKIDVPDHILQGAKCFRYPHS
ncbi:beta-lactamase [Desulfosporosinus sp. HMP52]|uniref:AtuA-related protein n=1 Tax=Desulfosporosinus sp. HMP52 TaxID=1487923 RepID=UPI00051FBA6C|nr:hypothetical protein [Desulfosporosinus sp. HMP52]KGK88961.1 beta-lactamase [Desulfosporosinus sp. HMP52]